MSYAEKERALGRAAAPALAAIVEDQQRAPRWLRPLFGAIRELLFAPDLTLEQIQEAAGFADLEVWTALREEVGQPPWSYIRAARMETAARLLAETEISISEIGTLVAYNSTSTFRRPLQTFLGMSASEYRRRAPALLRRMERAGSAPAGSRTDEYWERTLAGELSGDEARELDDFLGRLAPSSAPAGEGETRGSRLRRTLAEGLVESLEQLPFEQQRRLVSQTVQFPDDTFSELLGALSEDSAADPERGVELAQLAIDGLASNGMLATHPEYAARARERLARAQERAGDLRADR